MSDAISVDGLVKNFGQTRALDGLDLSVRTGEVHGFLGPNGAGKSTTIRVLLGMMRADAGTVRLLGGDPWTDATELHRRRRLSGGCDRDPILSGPPASGLSEQRRELGRERVSSAGREDAGLRPANAERERGHVIGPQWTCCCSTSRPQGWIR
jgi:ABC-type bacteriocin/lantibiotic exporter with double-glycine peptidase domain